MTPDAESTVSAEARFQAAGNSDAELFLRFRDKGDAGAFETLFARHREALVRHLWLLCGNEAIADDVSQYCWMKLIESGPDNGYRPTPGASLRSYLFTLGRNRFIDEYKRKHAETKSEALDDEQPLPSPGRDASEDAAADETRRLIVRILDDLPDEQREIIALWVEGYSIREMSKMTGSPTDTVNSRKKYAMKKLRIAFEEVGLRASHD